MLVSWDSPSRLSEIRLPAPTSVSENVPATVRSQPSPGNTPEPDPESFRDSNQNDSGDVDQAIYRFLETIGGKNSELAISIDKETQRIVIKVLDSETKEVIKQIPSKELLALAENLQRTGSGIFDQIA